MSEKLLYLSDLDGVLLKAPDHVMVNPENIDFFRRTKEGGHYAGIFTDHEKPEVDAIISDYQNYFRPFGIIACQDVSRHEKSDPAYYDDLEKRIAEEGWDVSRANYRLFEDTLANYRAAIKVGLTCTLVRHYQNEKAINMAGLDAEAVDSLGRIEIPR